MVLLSGLFHRAIVQSGSAHNPWALDIRASEIGIHAAVRVGCKNNNITTMVTCLQKIEAERYLEIPSLIKVCRYIIILYVMKIHYV
jgi:carboxylesterase type B